jgi:hypothetical protein
MSHILKVHGPNLGGGPFDTGYDSYLLDDPTAQTEIDGEWLIVKLPAAEGRLEDPVRAIRGRPSRGPMTITYPPGSWSKTVVFEKGEYPT